MPDLATRCLTPAFGPELVSRRASERCLAVEAAPPETPDPAESVQRPTSVLTRPVLIALGLTALGVGLAYALVGFPPLFGAEDAAIGFRYARNLAEGHGIVFNPGGERVEGFTSMLWLFVSAGVYKVFGEASLEIVLFAMSLGLTVFVLTSVLWVLMDRVPQGPGLWLGVVWLSAQAGFFFWSALSLMDVALWAAGLTIYLLLLFRRLEGRVIPPGSIPVVVVALVLTRPESMLVAPAAVLVAGAVYGLSGVVRRTVTDVVLTTVFAVAGLTAFRVVYFGHPLPNTYYAKVSPDFAYRLRSGVAYVGEYLAAHPLGWMAAAALLACLGVGGVEAVRRGIAPASDSADGAGARVATFTSGMIVVGVASVVFGGGDHYQGHRFLQAYVPMATIPLGLGLATVHERAAARWTNGGRGVAVAALVLAGAALPFEWTTFRGHDLRRQAFDVGLQGRFVGLTLDGVFADSRRPEMGLWMVGGAGYAYTGPVKDLLGLNWIAMGMSPGDRKGPRDHAAFNVDVFWSDPPELMIPEPEAVLRGVRCVRSVMGGAMAGVLGSPRLREEFEPVRIRRGDSEPIIAYARHDWVMDAPPVVERLGWAYCDG